MRNQLRQYLDGQMSRRDLFQRLLATGLTASAAQSMVEAADVDTQKAPNDPAFYMETGSGGDLLMEQVRAAGTRFIFSNPGSMETPFFDAFTDRPDLQLIMGLHEGIVIAMADGYNKISQKPAFVNIHAAVGTAQAGGQLYNAHFHGSALVVTAGMSDTTIFSDDMALAPRPGFTQADIPKQFTKISWEVREGSSSAAAIRRAYKLACASPGGPVYVAYSSKGLAERVSGRIWPGAKFMYEPKPRPAADQVESLSRMLIEAKRPIIRFGDEVWKGSAQADAVELAELLGIAVSSSRRAFQNFPTSHPQYVAGNVGRNPVYENGYSDLMVQCGARDPGGSSIPDEPITAAGGQYVAIGLDTNNMGRTQPLDLAMVADCGEAIRSLIDSVKSMVTSGRLARIRQERLGVIEPAVLRRTNAIKNAAQRNFENSMIHPDRLDYEIGQAADLNAIIVEENFTGRQNFQSYGYRDNEKLLLTKAGSLGWGVGAAAGAQIAAPGRQVILNIGDGATMYSSSGFWTMGRYEIPVLTIVWNNKNYQMVRSAYYRYKGRMVDADQFHGAYLGDPDIDFAKLAEAQGVSGERVTSPSDLPAALKRGLAATRDGKPYLLDVAVSRLGGGASSTWHHKYSVGASARSMSQDED